MFIGMTGYYIATSEYDNTKDGSKKKIRRFFGRLIVFLIINYLWGEYNIRKYNRYYESLEDGDEI